MQLKRRHFFRAGTRLMWIIDPKQESTAVYTSPTELETLAAKQWLTGGDVLPGFKVRLSEMLKEAWPIDEAR
jgi:Uma2 family endonuclease